MKYTIEQIAKIIDAEWIGNIQSPISFILTDSRSLCFPETTIFFALKTERNNGANYIAELFRRGVRNFVVESIPNFDKQDIDTCNFLIVPNVLKALQTFAKHHRQNFNIPIIGITGSNGKTMVKEWLYQLLSLLKNITRSPRSYNSQVGVPLSIMYLNKQTELGIFEAGISMPKEMHTLADIIQPTLGVFTTLGEAHQENFDTLKHKCIEKIALFSSAQALVYPYDESIVSECIAQSDFRGEHIAWSMVNENATLFVSNVIKKNISSLITYRWKTNAFVSLEIPYIDKASIHNIISCIAVASYLGVSTDMIVKQAALIEPVAMRLEVKEGQNGCTLINDSYNSDINSLDIALDFMNRRPEDKTLKRTIILSDILQSGEQTEALYENVATLLENRKIDKLIGIGNDITTYQHLFYAIQDKQFYPSVADFIKSDSFSNIKNEVVLIKGARKYGFDNITELLVERVHETVLEVNLNGIVENLNWYSRFLKPTTKLTCMIKADGYGCGALEIAKTLQEHNVDYLAVAVADEGVALRKSGITSNIIIMNPELHTFKTLFDNDLEPEVYSFRLLDALIKFAQKEGITNYPVHIKIDTGMHRLGFEPSTEVKSLIERLKSQNAIIPRSVFSHFVGADSDVYDDFSTLQYERFMSAAKQIQAAFDHKILCHIDNSAGIEHFPDRQLDMCRLGLGLYGVNPRNYKTIHNVSTLRTIILQIRDVAAGDTVGYARRGVVDRASRIAAIPIGYADGLNRKLGNRNGYCLVNGMKAYYIGNICMDVAMVDVTDIPCKEGDMVEIFGEHLPISVLSELLETIPYEIMTRVSNRVKRVYYKD